MFGALVEMLRRCFGGEGAAPRADAVARDDAPSRPSALELMQQMKAERANPADPAAWREGVATLKGRVFSPQDRARLWRRARRRYPGKGGDLDAITEPTTHDLAALIDLLRELDRS